ncbi:hypothetical protein [Aliarcobacter butzleri]|uniref:hypothetical protein n=1 Tax=Aliarcobacter butzleri TaxID=28197 RepID=UPI0021B52364|nr:hypothetical protein [Aliarcobacter butzleri]MCT7570851.1 hypothetical protein [Aliarcobacter butzleri]
MILANHFEDTRKSLLNISAKIIDIVHKRKVKKFEQVISLTESELQISYDKVILAVNFLYMTGGIMYDIESDTLRFENEA